MNYAFIFGRFRYPFKLIDLCFEYFQITGKTGRSNNKIHENNEFRFDVKLIKDPKPQITFMRN
jgi:hypothetical protein